MFFLIPAVILLYSFHTSPHSIWFPRDEGGNTSKCWIKTQKSYAYLWAGDRVGVTSHKLNF